MDGIREAARAYNERANEDEKESAKQFFKELDADGDGKASLAEFKASATADSRFRNDNVFKQLDANNDGKLDFDEALALYYMEKKLRILPCNSCDGLLVGSYFSCLLCLDKVSGSFDLCCSCYREGKFEHEHPCSNFRDQHSLLMLFRDRSTDDAEKNQGKSSSIKFLVEIPSRAGHIMGKLSYHFGRTGTAAAEKNQGKQEIEELREIAKAHHQAGPPEIQALAKDFFNSLDTDGDGQVEIPEFLAFMRQQGYPHMRNPHFFKELDTDGNGTLDFWEVMTVYYIIKSGRPFCDWCGNFVPGVYFSCVECFMSESSFSLCHDCYRSAKCNHNHKGKTQFLDNYTLLQSHKDSTLAQAAGAKKNKPSIWSKDVPNSSNDQAALKAFELALSIGNISATRCTIL